MKTVFLLLLAIILTNQSAFPQYSITSSRVIDTNVVGISLLSSDGLNKLGNISFQNGEGLKYVQFSSKGKDELLILTVLPETHQVISYCFYFFETTKADSQRIQMSTFNRFTTGKGISLGITQNQLELRLGKLQKVYHDGRITQCEYRLKSKQSRFLTTHHAKEYLASYKFIGNKLIEVNVQLFLE